MVRTAHAKDDEQDEDEFTSDQLKVNQLMASL